MGSSWLLVGVSGTYSYSKVKGLTCIIATFLETDWPRGRVAYFECLFCVCGSLCENATVSPHTMRPMSTRLQRKHSRRHRLEDLGRTLG